MTPVHSRDGSGISPLASLRADRAGRAVDGSDDAVVTIALLLRHAASAPGTPGARRALAASRRIARALLTPEDIREGAGFDEPRSRSPLGLLRTVADHALRARSSVMLADNILGSLSRLVPRDSPEWGRLLAQRAATSWYMGYNELSGEQYAQVLRLGRRRKERELVARAMHGLAHVRMSAGNLPEAERLSRRAIRIAGGDFPRVAAHATLKLGIVHAVRGDFDRGLGYAWRAYRLSRSYRSGRQAVLANIAQMLLDAGYPEAARAAATHLLRGAMPQSQRFAVLGTYASAAAAMADTRAVDACASTLLDLARTPSFAQHVADALLECSFALEQVGRGTRAKRLRARAHEIAVRHGYHDIAYLAEHGVRRGSPRGPSRISRATQAIVTEVRALEPETLSLRAVHAG